MRPLALAGLTTTRDLRSGFSNDQSTQFFMKAYHNLDRVVFDKYERETVPHRACIISAQHTIGFANTFAVKRDISIHQPSQAYV